MLALYLAICWETLLKLNIKPVYTVLELGKILYLKGLSAVKKIFWRSLFTQRLYTR